MDRQRSRVLIIGYGEMGHAMERLLAGNHQLTLHDSRPVSGLPPVNVGQAAARADFVLLCVPASPHRDVLNKLAAHLQSHCICISIAKGLAGLGDLITTATSPGSHHHELGRKLARGKTQGVSGEGIHTLEMVARHSLFDTSPYPLYRLIDGIVRRPVDAAQMFNDYLLASGNR